MHILTMYVSDTRTSFIILFIYLQMEFYVLICTQVRRTQAYTML